MAKTRTSKAALFRFIHQTRTPIYVVAENLRIVFCNPALCDWIDQNEEFLTGLTCLYHSGIDLAPSQKIAAGLCPPPEALQGELQNGFVTKSSLVKLGPLRNSIGIPIS